MIHATNVLAEASPTGMNYWLWLAPVIVALALITYILLTRHASRKRIRHQEPDRTEHRGPVRGGVIEGDGGQRKASRPMSPDQRP